MLTIIRYALAIFCFAASVGCLALWWRSITRLEYVGCVLPTIRHAIHVETNDGMCIMYSPSTNDGFFWNAESEIKIPPDRAWEDRFPIYLGKLGPEFYFPLWYPALIFALTGVAVLRFRRQFSIRSAMVATTVVAALIGMAVIL